MRYHYVQVCRRACCKQGWNNIGLALPFLNEIPKKYWSFSYKNKLFQFSNRQYWQVLWTTWDEQLRSICQLGARRIISHTCLHRDKALLALKQTLSLLLVWGMVALLCSWRPWLVWVHLERTFLSPRQTAEIEARVRSLPAPCDLHVWHVSEVK